MSTGKRLNDRAINTYLTGPGMASKVGKIGLPPSVMGVMLNRDNAVAIVIKSDASANRRPVKVVAV